MSYITLDNMELNRPRAQQSSRKGKKSWRKNVDIGEVEQGLIDARERKRLFGDEEDEAEFVIDVSRDEKLRDKEAKRLKSREILTNKSKVKPLESNHRKKIQGVNKSEVHRLMKLSGRVQNESAWGARVEKEGLVKADSGDIWGEEEKSNKPEILEKFSDRGITRAKHAPKTLREEPISISEVDVIIDAGRSYNPSLESWKKLINKEFLTEKEKETKRQELQDFQNKVAEAMSRIEEESSDDEVDDNSEEETGDFKLSSNKPVTVKKKTKTKRNKEKRHKQKVELENQYKLLKAQIAQLSQLNADEPSGPEEPVKAKKKPSKKQKKLFKYNALEAPLDVQLSHELTNNMRSVKTEGNLFYDQMNKLQASGKVEARVPVSKKRKYTPKITEKWSYKDFK